MKNYNPDIIYVRSYGGSLIPISKVSLVTVDPNNNKVVQEIPLKFCIEKLIHENMNNFVKSKKDWHDIDTYNILQEKSVYEKS